MVIFVFPTGLPAAIMDFSVKKYMLITKYMIVLNSLTPKMRVKNAKIISLADFLEELLTIS